LDKEGGKEIERVCSSLSERKKGLCSIELYDLLEWKKTFETTAGGKTGKKRKKRTFGVNRATMGGVE